MELEYCLVVGYPYLFMDLAARWLNFGLLVNYYTWTLMAVVGGARWLVIVKYYVNSGYAWARAGFYRNLYFTKIITGLSFSISLRYPNHVLYSQPIKPYWSEFLILHLNPLFPVSLDSLEQFISLFNLILGFPGRLECSGSISPSRTILLDFADLLLHANSWSWKAGDFGFSSV